MSTAFLLLFGVSWLAIGTFVSATLTMAGGRYWDDLILDRRSVVAQAQPTLVEPTRGRISGRRIFRLDYTFVDTAGAAHTSSTRTLSPLMTLRARRGTPLEIEYDPGAPERSRLRGERGSVTGLPGLIPFAIALAGVVALAFGVGRSLRLRGIYVHGQAAVATITRVAPTQLRVNWQRVMRADYVFDAGIERVSGRATARVPPALGARIWILYDTADPKRSVPAV